MTAIAEVAMCRANACRGKDRPADVASDPAWPLCSHCLAVKKDIERRWGPRKLSPREEDELL